VRNDHCTTIESCKCCTHEDSEAAVDEDLYWMSLGNQQTLAAACADSASLAG
jgi:hypothetical protein